MVDGFAPAVSSCFTSTATTLPSRMTASKLCQVNSMPPKGGGDSRNNDDDDSPRDYLPDEEFNFDDDSKGATVDWDAEWKKVMREQNAGNARDRPDGGYKTEAEVAAIRAANKATEQINRAASVIPEIPPWSSLKGDWRFWIGILAFLSIGTSLLTASAMNMNPPQPISSDGSYYI
mmetsp:Transcript_20830/g.26911  ORF Transcript_20830/g.26911 Transcript_20830/m.26911 type:complete len:176 (-) Transcript_20830:354-881(-)